MPSPPPRRRLGWRSQALRSVVYQAALLLLIAAAAALLLNNTLHNMAARGMQSGFDFLFGPAGFDIGDAPMAYDALDPYWKAFAVGLANTLRVAAAGIVLATLLGLLIGMGRFSGNLLIEGCCYGYVEAFRNVPVLLQLLMWYLLLAEMLPDAESRLQLGAWLTLDKSGLMVLGLSLTPEFLALLGGLVLYTAAYIGEVVRAGIASVGHGQLEAACSLGLSRWQTMRRIVLPQAMRVIVPPLTSQYLNLTKNSSLAVAIGYPELVSVVNTSINQTGRAVECICVLMAVYLGTSLLTSALMNAYNRRMALKER